MNILILDTSTEHCVVALKTAHAIYARSHHEIRQHARVIFHLIENVLNEAAIEKNAIDVIAFGCGPGSFTGLRIAASVAQSLAFGLSKPVVPISTLQLLAQSAFTETDVNTVLVSIDARMDEIYWAVFTRDTNGIATLQGTEHLSKSAQVIFPKAKSWMITGSALHQFPDLLSAAERDPHCVLPIPDQLMSPVAMLQLAESKWKSGAAVAPELALPVYLRDDVVK
jgi:tRNA threonylcarbamoyladenosine biosynthesis protein TsaB